MISQKIFGEIKKYHKNYASWAIWAQERKGENLTDNMGDLSIFDEENIAKHLKKLNPNIILVGLNISREIRKPLSNFHGTNGGAYKIRHALSGSPFEGGYMTDIIKGYVQSKAMKVMRYLKTKEGKFFEKENVQNMYYKIEKSVIQIARRSLPLLYIDQMPFSCFLERLPPFRMLPLDNMLTANHLARRLY